MSKNNLIPFQIYSALSTPLAGCYSQSSRIPCRVSSQDENRPWRAPWRLVSWASTSSTNMCLHRWISIAGALQLVSSSLRHSQSQADYAICISGLFWVRRAFVEYWKRENHGMYVQHPLWYPSRAEKAAERLSSQMKRKS